MASVTVFLVLVAAASLLSAVSSTGAGHPLYDSGIRGLSHYRAAPATSYQRSTPTDVVLQKLDACRCCRCFSKFCCHLCPKAEANPFWSSISC